ncbi:hypothetical protein B0H16DRAFT_1550001 [Mycena metata]|uniref:Uncharacterized protein n=1 Tax=Mycena metata TaxID=1033252 RepID=A0AAD7N7M3_9AGAR|nr:hypothetical protein B0H16DRAFT_1550001 [Mycena metata]
MLCAVRFKPRPPHPIFGTEWIPRGLEYRPYHPHLDDEPEGGWAGMDERKFKCSATLERYLVEFYGEIKGLFIDLPPLDDLPSVEDSDVLCNIANRFRSHADRAKLLDFRALVLKQALDCFGALSEEARAKVALPTILGEVPPGELLSHRIIQADMLSMRSELIELKVWVSVLKELLDYIYRRTHYMEEFLLRHPADHLCPVTFGMLVEQLGSTFGKFLRRPVDSFLRPYYHPKVIPRDDVVTPNIGIDEAPRHVSSAPPALRLRNHP